MAGVLDVAAAAATAHDASAVHSADASPTKGCDPFDLTSYAKRLPKYATTGCDLIDGKREAAYETLQRVISACQKDEDHVLTCWSVVQKREKRKAEILHADSSDTFDSFGTINVSSTTRLRSSFRPSTPR